MIVSVLVAALVVLLICLLDFSSLFLDKKTEELLYFEEDGLKTDSEELVEDSTSDNSVGEAAASCVGVDEDPAIVDSLNETEDGWQEREEQEERQRQREKREREMRREREEQEERMEREMREKHRKWEEREECEEREMRDKHRKRREHEEQEERMEREMREKRRERETITPEQAGEEFLDDLTEMYDLE